MTTPDPLAVRCPVCQAEPGGACQGTWLHGATWARDGVTRAPHAERVNVATREQRLAGRRPRPHAHGNNPFTSDRGW